MHVVVAYDISKDKQRKKVSDLLETLLPRVQKSVFEGEVPRAPLRKLIGRAVKHIDEEGGDSLRVYYLCAGCAPRIETFGRFIRVEEEEVQVY